MDLYIQNVRTGETNKLNPERTLIGSADHATVRLAEGGPYLAAFVVRYPTGWAMFGLGFDGEAFFNRRPLRAGQRVTPRPGDLLTIDDERYAFLSPSTEPTPEPLERPVAPPCYAYILSPDGKEECRAVDHDILIGRLENCHVQFGDSRMSRLCALLASNGECWYVHNLSKKVIGRNRKGVTACSRLADGDELQLGPLVVRIEIRSETDGAAPPTQDEPRQAAPNGRRLQASSVPASPTDTGEATDDGTGESTHGQGADLAAVRAHAQRLEQWLKALPDPAPQARAGIGGWLGTQRDRLRRFWLDTPETTSARSLRSAGRVEEAFAVLERAIRARPDGPELLRELYRLYEALGFHDLSFRPLRQIEKLAEARGSPDVWVLETLAQVCTRLGPTRPAMFDRAIAYWHKLEHATGESTSRQRANVLALRTIREGGYTGAAEA